MIEFHFPACHQHPAVLVMDLQFPNAPSVYSLTANPDLAAQRQQYVLQQMVKYGYLGEEEAAAILQN